MPSRSQIARAGSEHSRRRWRPATDWPCRAQMRANRAVFYSGQLPPTRGRWRASYRREPDAAVGACRYLRRHPRRCCGRRRNRRPKSCAKRHHRRLRSCDKRRHRKRCASCRRRHVRPKVNRSSASRRCLVKKGNRPDEPEVSSALHEFSGVITVDRAVRRNLATLTPHPRRMLLLRLSRPVESRPKHG